MGPALPLPNHLCPPCFTWGLVMAHTYHLPTGHAPLNLAHSLPLHRVGRTEPEQRLSQSETSQYVLVWDSAQGYDVRTGCLCLLGPAHVLKGSSGPQHHGVGKRMAVQPTPLTGCVLQFQTQCTS